MKIDFHHPKYSLLQLILTITLSLCLFTLILVLFGSLKVFTPSNSIKLVMASSYVVNNSNVTNHEDFVQLCFDILSTKHSLRVFNVKNDLASNESSAQFDKSFERNFFQRLFGPKRIVYTGYLIFQSNPLNPPILKFESEWRKFYSDIKFERAEINEQEFGVHSDKIAKDLIKWKP